MPTIQWEQRRDVHQWFFRTLERYERLRFMDTLGIAVLAYVLLFLFKNKGINYLLRAGKRQDISVSHLDSQSSWNTNCVCSVGIHSQSSWNKCNPFLALARRRRLIIIAVFLPSGNQSLNGFFQDLMYCIFLLVPKRMEQNQNFVMKNYLMTCNMFTFQKVHFFHMMDAMGLRIKILFCGRKRKGQKFPADICLMVILQRLAYPCRFVDLMNIFWIQSNRLCDIFHSTLDYLFHR